MGTILVTGIKCYAYHGCLEEEAVIGGHYVVDVELETDFEEAAKNDDLSKTVDYSAVNAIVREQMSIRSKLIEQVAKRIHDEMIKKLPGIKSAVVKVTKFNPPVNGDIQQVTVIYTN